MYHGKGKNMLLMKTDSIIVLLLILLKNVNIFTFVLKKFK